MADRKRELREYLQGILCGVSELVSRVEALSDSQPGLVDIEGVARLLGVTEKQARLEIAKFPRLVQPVRISHKNVRYDRLAILELIAKRSGRA
jgi:hypothetical protein